MSLLLHISQKSSTFALDLCKGTKILWCDWCDATMAQLVEQRIRNAWVRGSSPRSGSLFENE